MSRSDKAGWETRTEDAVGAPARPGVSVVAGDVIGRFRVLRELGRGGMGCVLLAEDDVLGRPVALKVIRAAHADVDDQRRFLREARSAARLRHPGIVAVYDAGEHEGRPFLAMEYVEGETLVERLRRGPLPADALLDLARQLSAALGAAHDAGVVHRDLKPGNIMCAADGRVRLLDFGLARSELVDAAPDAVTATGVLMGTPAYMAPEQARGERVSAASDVFALGLVLHEAATGRSPFAAAPNVVAVLASILTETPPALSTLRTDLPPGFADVVARCLEKDVARRFRSATEVLRALVEPAPSAPAHAATVPAAPASVGPPGSPAAPSLATPSAAPPTSAVSSGACVMGRVAVIPWRNTARDPSHDWLGVGIADTVAHELRRSQGLSVVEDARVGGVVGAIVARGGTPELLDIARALEAEWVVSGSYQVAGGRVRIVGVVANGRTSVTTPGDRIDGRIDDIFDLQDRLVEQVRGIVGSGRAAPMSKEVRLTPGNADAYERYARAVMVSHAMTTEASLEAERLLNEALALDPTYALAHASLGTMRMMLSLATGTPSLEEAAVCLERAVALNPGLAEAHLWLSHTRMLQGEHSKGIEHARLAAALNPTNAFTQMNLGIACGARSTCERRGPDGLVEALHALRRAVELEPESGAGWSNLGLWALSAGDVNQARAAFERALALEGRVLAPGQERVRWVGARVFLGVIELYEGRLAIAERELSRGVEALRGDRHVFAGAIELFGLLMKAECALRSRRVEDAIAAFQSVVDATSRAPPIPGLGHQIVRAHLGLARALGVAGRATEARATLGIAASIWARPEVQRLAGFAALPSFSAYDLASATAATGDPEAAVAALDEAHAFAWCASVMLDGDPCFERLRDDPRLVALRARADEATTAVGPSSRG